MYQSCTRYFQICLHNVIWPAVALWPRLALTASVDGYAPARNQLRIKLVAEQINGSITAANRHLQLAASKFCYESSTGSWAVLEIKVPHIVVAVAGNRSRAASEKRGHLLDEDRVIAVFPWLAVSGGELRRAHGYTPEVPPTRRMGGQFRRTETQRSHSSR
jgi:hypothetical protein